jgi:predicted ATP-grasp superfamily ATP-dependent carboligase
MIGLLKSLANRGVWVGTQPTVKNNITTAGTTQATAVQLNDDVNVLAVVAAGATGAVLPKPDGVGASCIVLNIDSADTALIYPAVGGKINALAANASLSLAAGKSVLFVSVNATDWVSFLTA